MFRRRENVKLVKGKQMGDIDVSANCTVGFLMDCIEALIIYVMNEDCASKAEMTRFLYLMVKMVNLDEE